MNFPSLFSSCSRALGKKQEQGLQAYLQSKPPYQPGRGSFYDGDTYISTTSVKEVPSPTRKVAKSNVDPQDRPRGMSFLMIRKATRSDG
jgi:hypothetical protein